MSIRWACAGLSGLAVTLVCVPQSFAHEIVGNRFFPATLGIDDPGVNDELALPTVDSFHTGDNPTARGANGFQNFETTFKYRVFKDPVHEFVMSVGLSVEWGGTGSSSVGAEAFNVYTPTFYFGKGLGDLPDTLSWLR